MRVVGTTNRAPFWSTSTSWPLCSLNATATSDSTSSGVRPLDTTSPRGLSAMPTLTSTLTSVHKDFDRRAGHDVLFPTLAEPEGAHAPRVALLESPEQAGDAREVAGAADDQLGEPVSLGHHVPGLR